MAVLGRQSDINILNLEYDLTRNLVICKTPVSLYQLAMVKVATSICVQEDVIIKLLQEEEKLETCFEGSALNKIPALQLPCTHKEDLEFTVLLVCRELQTFMKGSRIHQQLELSKFICWTYEGTIDIKTTGARLVNSDLFNVEDKYEIC